MRATIGRLAALGLTAALAMLALGGTATAKKSCSPSGGSLAPKLTSPCAGASIRAGHNFTWKVTDDNPNAGEFHPYLNVTRSKPKHGILADNKNGKGIYVGMKGVKGHPDRFTYKTPSYTFPGYWLVSKGTWYVQVQQIDSTGTNDTRYSPVETIHVS